MKPTTRARDGASWIGSPVDCVPCRGRSAGFRECTLDCLAPRISERTNEDFRQVTNIYSVLASGYCSLIGGCIRACDWPLYVGFRLNGDKSMLKTAHFRAHYVGAKQNENSRDNSVDLWAHPPHSLSSRFLQTFKQY
jgi:hypothetical protein